MNARDYVKVCVYTMFEWGIKYTYVRIYMCVYELFGILMPR